MTIAESLTKLSSDISAAYDAVATKGGTVPKDKNTDNLATAINSITGGGSVRPPLPEYPYPVDEAQLEAGEYGAIAYLRDDTVHYYTATSSTDLANLAQNSANRTFKTLDDGFAITSQNVLAYKFGSTQTSTGNYFLVECPLLQSIYFNENGALVTIGSYFLRNAVNFNSPLDFPSTVTSIAAYALQGCEGFNQPITLPTSIVSIGGSFLFGCSNFNQPIIIPEGIETINSRFMAGCTNFNSPLQFPATLRTIGALFLQSCLEFDQPLSFADGLKTIDYGFMSVCRGFNSTIVLPDTVTTIADDGGSYGFMTGCIAFDQPFQIPAGVTVIPTGFLAQCTHFNSQLEFRGAVKVIYSDFLNGCTAFNQPLTLPNTLQEIGARFMSGCISFTQPLVVPASLRYTDNFFMYDCQNFIGPLTIETSSTPGSAASYSLACARTTYPMYATGVIIQGPGAQAWRNALPDSTTSPYRKLILAEEA